MSQIAIVGYATKTPHGMVVGKTGQSYDSVQLISLPAVIEALEEAVEGGGECHERTPVGKNLRVLIIKLRALKESA